MEVKHDDDLDMNKLEPDVVRDLLSIWLRNKCSMDDLSFGIFDRLSSGEIAINRICAAAGYAVLNDVIRDALREMMDREKAKEYTPEVEAELLQKLNEEVLDDKSNVES